MTVFNIRVYVDTVCAWCYIGHKSLDRAIDLYKKTYPGGSKDEFIFIYSPYYVNANAPVVGVPLREQMALKNGPDKVNAILTRVKRVGQATGIAFSFNSKIGNTRDSHRLLRYALQAKGHEVHKELLEKIFHWHYEEDGDITSHAGLAQAAVAVGLPEKEVLAFLESDAGGEEVDRLEAEAREAGVHSVPTIDINGKRIDVEGAGEPQEFYEALIDAKTFI